MQMSTGDAGRLTKSVRDPRPLSERVYDHLRDAIVAGEIPPDTQVRQEQVAADLGVSRTPVREALSRLAQEDLVTLVPGTGFLVNELREADIAHVYEVRMSLESTAASLACPRHTAASIARLRGLIQEMAATDPGDSDAQFGLNRRFHQALNDPCGNPILLKMIDDLWDRPINRRITTAYLHGGENTHSMIAEHRAIVDALENHEVDRVVDLVQGHLGDGYLIAQEARPDDARPRVGNLSVKGLADPQAGL